MGNQDEVLNIPTITLEWSEWIPWADLWADARNGGVRVPNRKPGVYEAKLIDTDERLTIGKTSNLRRRIKQGLVKGKAKHSAGKDIRANEDLTKIVVRWAVTDWPAATEEALHKKHIERFGGLPKHTDHT